MARGAAREGLGKPGGRRERKGWSAKDVGGVQPVGFSFDTFDGHERNR